MDSHRLTRRVYVWSCSFVDQGVRNWVCKTRSMMNSLGHLETPPSSGNIWEALALKEFENWSSTVQNVPDNSESGGRFRFYRAMKSTPSLKPYVITICSHNKKRVLTMLRCGTLLLEIKTGSYRSPKLSLNSRTCILCSSGDVGDEVHFLTLCPALAHLRSKLFEAMSALDQPAEENFFSLTPIAKTTKIIHQCATSPEVGKAVYRLAIS